MDCITTTPATKTAHPAAAMFPMMEADQLRELADDIKANGLREPVVYFREQLLDGRNRLAACKLVGVEADTCEIDAEDICGKKFDPIAYVVSANLRRRHLSESQRAMIAVEAEKFYAKTAKERQKRKPADSVPALAPEQNGDSRDQAAATVGVGSRSVSSAKRVVADGALEVGSAVRAGHLSVTVAEKLVRAVPDKSKQAEIIRAELNDQSATRTNDSRVKSRLWYVKEGREKASKPKDDSPPMATNGRPPVGVARANEAIDCLMRIPKNDRHRKRAFEIVRDWIEHNEPEGGQ